MLVVVAVLVTGCASDGSPRRGVTTTVSPGPPTSGSSTAGPLPASPGPQGRPLACPFPEGPQGVLSTAQAADCLMARWASGDASGAAAYATSAAATVGLFAVAPRGLPTALECAEASPVPSTDATAAGPPMACTYALAEGGVATLFVVSTAARGAAVFSATVT